MLRAIKLDPNTIKRAILSVDTDTLPRFAISELLKFVPTEADISALKQFENEHENLASAEKFMYVINQIPRYDQMLKAMLFKVSFAETQEDTQNMIVNLDKACKDVSQSKKVKELFRIILALGNYMNSGQRGGAFGFKLQSVLKMIDTKSNIASRKHTMLHFLIESMDKKFPEISNFQNELAHVEEGSKVAIPQVRTLLIGVRDSIKSLKELLEKISSESNSALKQKTSNSSLKSGSSSHSKTSSELQTKFEEMMHGFLSYAEDAYKKMDSDFKNAEKSFELACAFYGEESKTTTPEEFFGVFSRLCQSFTIARQENEQATAKMIADKKREEAKREIQAKPKKDEPKTSAGKEEGIDDLIMSIRSGKAFGGGEAARQRRGNNEESTINRRKSIIARANDESLINRQKSIISRDESLNNRRKSIITREKLFNASEQSAVGRLKRPDKVEKSISQKRVILEHQA